MTNPTTTIWSLPKAKKPRARFYIEITTGGMTIKTWGSRRRLVQMFDDLHSDPEKLEQIQEMTVMRIVKRPGERDDLFDLCHYDLDTLEYFTYHGDL
tara:strand:- start:2995 stop:3285 length:291 start_codon:yes stop_codon:yes gene_type:complete